MTVLTMRRGEVIPLPQLTLGELVRKARRDAGLEQEQLAELIHVSRPLVSKWERNINVPNVEQFLALINATGARWLIEYFTDHAA